MKLIETIICNQYFELKAKGLENKVFKNSVFITGLFIVVSLLAIFITAIIFFPELNKSSNTFIHRSLKLPNGKIAGKIIGIVLIIIAYISAKYILVTKKKYQKIINKFKKLPKQEQEIISKKGMKIFLLPVAVTIFSAIVLTFQNFI